MSVTWPWGVGQRDGGPRVKTEEEVGVWLWTGSLHEKGKLAGEGFLISAN